MISPGNAHGFSGRAGEHPGVKNILFLTLLFASFAGSANAQSENLKGIREQEEFKWHNSYPIQYKDFHKWLELLKAESKKTQKPFADEVLLKLYLSEAYPCILLSNARKDPKFQSRLNASTASNNPEVLRAKLLAECWRTGGKNHPQLLKYVKDHPDDDVMRANYVYWTSIMVPKLTADQLRKKTGEQYEMLKLSESARKKSSYIEMAVRLYEFELALLQKNSPEVDRLGKTVAGLCKKYPRNPHLSRLYLFIQAYQRKHGRPILPDIEYGSYNDYSLIDEPPKFYPYKKG